MAEIFKIGDTVRLAVGGPEMVITKLTEDANGSMIVWTSWMVGKTQRDGSFPVDSVERS